jgi:hypothetical protein
MIKLFSEIKLGEIFSIQTYLVHYTGSIENFQKIPRKKHIGDNAICLLNGRTTFINSDEMVDLKEIQ